MERGPSPRVPIRAQLGLILRWFAIVRNTYDLGLHLAYCVEKLRLVELLAFPRKRDLIKTIA
jgi:hypothetical protein